MALTVRRPGAASSGTIQAPVPVALDLSVVDPAPIERRQRLGYEALPATAVYRIASAKRFELQLSRSSSDRYAVHIQITVINGAGQTVYAITTANGIGEWALLPAGEYRIVAALLIPEEVELALTIAARPARTRIGPVVATGSGGGVARLGRGITVAAEGRSPSVAIPTKPHLQGVGGGSGGALLMLLAVQGASSRCRCIAASTGSASGQLAPMQWVDALGRPMGPGISIVPMALADPVLIWGTDWQVSIRLVAATGGGRDLSGITFHAALWDQERSVCYATCSVVVDNPLDGGPITAVLTPEQSAQVGRYLGEEVVFDLWGVDEQGQLAYLLTGLVPCQDKVTVWPETLPEHGPDLFIQAAFVDPAGRPVPLAEGDGLAQLLFPNTED